MEADLQDGKDLWCQPGADRILLFTLKRVFVVLSSVSVRSVSSLLGHSHVLLLQTLDLLFSIQCNTQATCSIRSLSRDGRHHSELLHSLWSSGEHVLGSVSIAVCSQRLQVLLGAAAAVLHHLGEDPAPRLSAEVQQVEGVGRVEAVLADHAGWAAAPALSAPCCPPQELLQDLRDGGGGQRGRLLVW